MITYFTNDTEAKPESVQLTLDNLDTREYTILRLDDKHNGEAVGTLAVKGGQGHLSIDPNTVVYLQSL